MTTEEGNKLIADFMGVKIGVDNYSWRLGCVEPLKEGHLAYRSSWGWLMPVVEKIESLPAVDLYEKYFVQIDGNNCLIHKNGTVVKYLPLVCKPTKMEAVWLAVVNFIQWQKQQ